LTVTTDTETQQAAVPDTAEEASPVDTVADVPLGARIAEPPDSAADGRRRRRRRRIPIHRQLLLFGLTTVVTLAGVAGWLGWRSYQTQQITQQRVLFLEAGRQGAVNLTTIDWRNADGDVQRILDSATGTFYDEFTKRSQPLIEVVKQVQSTSQGKITAAGLESVSGTEAQVLVAVSVKISNTAAPEQNPRSWRMRITVQKVGQDVKVSNVEFVP
jgi:Mce-associated membrane protein